MKLKDILTLETTSVNPQDKPETIWHLYSLPSFDDGKQCEQVLGKEILSNKYLVPSKCILFNKLNVRFKRIWAVFNANELTICSTEFLPLVVNEDVADFNYAYHLLHSDQITKYLTGQNTNTSGSHKRIDPNDFLNIEVNLPSIKEQKRIGLILSKIERKIDLNSEINQNLEAMAKQLYDYWFVQFDFPNEEGKPYKSSGGVMTFYDCLGMEIPLTWQICQLHDFINSHNTGDWGTDEPLDKNSIQVGCIRGADIIKLNNLPTRYIKGNNTCKLLRPWDIVIEVSGGSPVQATGRSALITDGVIERNGGKITCSNFCHAFSMNNPEEAVYFFYLWRVLYENDLMFNFEGKTSGIKNFMTDAFLANYWYKADDKLISSFFERVNPLIAQMDCNIKENNQLIQQRDELLPLLMNGQVSVTQLNSDLSAY